MKNEKIQGYNCSEIRFLLEKRQKYPCFYLGKMEMLCCFLSPKPHPHSKKTPIFAHVSLKSIPCEGYRDNFLRK